MLLDPQLDQRFREPAAERQEPMDPGMAGGAEGDELVGGMDPGPPVVHMDPPWFKEASLTGAAAAFVAFEDGFAVAGEVGAGVRAGAVAGAAQTGDGGDSLAAVAEEGALAVPQKAGPHGQKRSQRLLIIYFIITSLRLFCRGS